MRIVFLVKELVPLIPLLVRIRHIPRDLQIRQNGFPVAVANVLYSIDRLCTRGQFTCQLSALWMKKSNGGKIFILHKLLYLIARFPFRESNRFFSFHPPIQFEHPLPNRTSSTFDSNILWTSSPRCWFAFLYEYWGGYPTAASERHRREQSRSSDTL